jgi:hypothetical protein
MRRFVFSFAMLAIASCLPVAAYADQQQDKQIAQTVIQRLQKEKESGRLKGFSIDLQVENGTLWLSGRVVNKEQQAAALDVARRVPGVKQVVNDLSIAAPPAARPTTQLVANSTVGSGVTPVNGTSPSPAQLAPATAQPMYAPQQGQRPVAFAPAYSVAMANANANFPGHHLHRHAAPAPMYAPAMPEAAPPARYDAPQMPGYAWPSYASHPNYAAVTYPKQYSASAWPYIGPFYPYPQVPLGWRKVTMEWDDGWWFLDFKDGHCKR